MTISPYSFSLVLDQQSPIGRLPSMVDSAKAHIVLQTIVSGGVVVSDTQCLVAPNVSRLLRVDSVTRELVREKRLRVALRDKDPNGYPSSSLSDLVGIHRDTAEDALEVARFVDASGDILQWSTDAISQNYAKGTVDLFRNRFSAEEPELKSITNDFVDGIIANNRGKINRIDFHTDFPSHLRAYNYDLSERILQKIQDFASAYYFGALPTTLGLVSVYGDQHRRSVEYRFGFQTAPNPADSVESVDSSLDLTKLVDGLANMPIDDVLRLADSPEAQTYRSLVEISHGHSNELHLSETVHALQLLNYRIDEAILANSPTWRVRKSKGNGRVWRKRIDWPTAAGGITDIVALIYGWGIPLLGTLIGGFSTVLAKRLNDEGKKTAEEYAAHQTSMHLLKESLRREGRAEEITLSGPTLPSRFDNKPNRNQASFVTSWNAKL